MNGHIEYGIIYNWESETELVEVMNSINFKSYEFIGEVKNKK